MNKRIKKFLIIGLALTMLAASSIMGLARDAEYLNDIDGFGVVRCELECGRYGGEACTWFLVESSDFVISECEVEVGLYLVDVDEGGIYFYGTESGSDTIWAEASITKGSLCRDTVYYIETEHTADLYHSGRRDWHSFEENYKINRG